MRCLHPSMTSHDVGSHYHAGEVEVDEGTNDPTKCQRCLSVTPDVQDMDWLFYSNNPLYLEVVAVSLPFEFKVPKATFEGRSDPRAHFIQYNDYMNVLEASDATKCNLGVVKVCTANRVLLLRVYMYNVGDNRGIIRRINNQGHFRNLRVNTPEVKNQLERQMQFHNDRRHKKEDCSFLNYAINEAVRNGELKDFVGQDALPSGQSSRDTNKGKHGIIHVIIDIDEEWVTSNMKKKAHLRSMMSVSSSKRLRQ
ncbi:hypothetical protein J1N35_041141 [Gossypium stocksii]|uniref:Uncharacterized protein n=1 Tax=Gossypium stocksii TaxID=47602 RepID=A0A9D3UFK0_9ROSI|nr:hypothetical protein J1N35_041141 [Gossypium stocksii]